MAKQWIRVYFKQINQCHYDVPVGTAKGMNNRKIAEANALAKWRHDHAWPEIESVEDIGKEF